MDLMNIRRRMLMASGKNQYEFYDYIEFILGTYLDTNYVVTVSPKIVTRIKIMTPHDSDIFGFANNIYPSFICDPANYGLNWYNRWGATPYTRFAKQIYNIADCTFGQNTIIDGTECPPFDDTDWSSNTQSMLIGRGRNTDCDLQVYAFKFYDGDILVRDMKPCRRKSDDAIGMYDRVTKAFYLSVGTPILGNITE